MENPAVIPNNPLLPVEKKRRVSNVKVKDEYVKENTQLKIKVSQLEAELRKFSEMPTMRRIVWAIKGDQK